ncbi:hypothetical protein RRG08_018431 [Elysia crispata]|uniref:Glycine N-acyltransferase-like protein n=1 Tax=Elysia crispata TaxID=231223 RepID=A0AAE1BAN3_9GAST|nr:hypothetical protein RRG08_018431 [Elysia crispata]
MEATLHRVTGDELPALRDWLKHHLPETFRLYNTTEEIIRGRWQGTSFLTLGWPDIQAVGEGPVSPDDIDCAAYFMEPRVTCVFSPSPDQLTRLLTAPDIYDWTRPILFFVFSTRLSPTIREVSEARGGNPDRAQRQACRLVARPGDVPLLPVPEELEARALDPDLHSDLVYSNWDHSRKHCDLYIRQLLGRFPSVGLFDKSGRCVAHELGKHYGTIGFLHVHEEFRGRGLGKVVLSLLAHKYLSQGLTVTTLVFADHKHSLAMHTSMGFHIEGDLHLYTHYIGAPDENEGILNFG